MKLTKLKLENWKMIRNNNSVILTVKYVIFIFFITNCNSQNNTPDGSNLSNTVVQNKLDSSVSLRFKYFSDSFFFIKHYSHNHIELPIKVLSVAVKSLELTQDPIDMYKLDSVSFYSIDLFLNAYKIDSGNIDTSEFKISILYPKLPANSIYTVIYGKPGTGLFYKFYFKLIKKTFKLFRLEEYNT